MHRGLGRATNIFFKKGFMTNLEDLNFTLAFRRLEQDKRDDVWPDVVGYRDYRHGFDANIEALKQKTSEPKSYQAQFPLEIDVPKKGFTLRSGVVPIVEDRVLYQSIADFLSPYFVQESCVYSNRLSPRSDSTRMFVPGVELWLQFQNQVESLCQQHSWVVTTDITAYFDHINQDLMVSRINDIFQNKVDKQFLATLKILLKRLWGKWSRVPRFGIPQVNDASSFFGNLYLDELDKWASRRGYHFLRYVDDIRIFTDDEPSARRALAELIVKMRDIGLYVASGKTSIQKTEQVLRDLGYGRDRINAIETELYSGLRGRVETAAYLLGDYFVEIVEDIEHFNDRHFRYCVNRFKRLQASGLGTDIHARVTDEVLKRLHSMPYSTDIFVDYLSMFPNNEKIQHSVIEFLNGPYNIYPWQQMLLLELLVRSDVASNLLGAVMNTARTVINDTSHPAPKSKALVLLGKNGDYADRREIRSIYRDEPREEVRRAIIFSVQEMQSNERDNFYRGLLNDSSSIRNMCQYVQQLQSPTYHYFDPPTGFNFIELYEYPNDSDDLDDLGSEFFS